MFKLKLQVDLNPSFVYNLPCALNLALGHLPFQLGHISGMRDQCVQ